MSYKNALIQCAAILINDYGFQRVDVQNIKDEIWLSHATRKEFNLVRIYLSDKSFLNDKHTKQILGAIKSVFHQDSSFLELSIDDSESSLTQKEDRLIAKLSATQIPERILEAFPHLSLMFEEMDEAKLKQLEASIQKKDRVSNPKSFLAFLKVLPRGTLILSIALILISMIINGVSLLGYDIFATTIFFGAYYKTLINAHLELYRFLTYGFIHTDPFHLAMNVFALINLGNFMERIYGTAKFLMTVFVGIIVGSLFVYVAQGNVLLVGISAGLYAVLGVLGVYLVETGLIKQPQIRSQLWRMVMINIFINFIPSISVVGHMGGLLAGVFMGFGFSKSSHLAFLKRHAWIALGLLVVMVSSLGFRDQNATPLYPQTDQWIIELARDARLSWYADDLEASLNRYYVKVGLQ